MEGIKPEEDVVKVIRCRKCRYYQPDYMEKGEGRCNSPHLGRGICFITKLDWFCADGKEKGNNEAD